MQSVICLESGDSCGSVWIWTGVRILRMTVLELISALIIEFKPSDKSYKLYSHHSYV
ncbi:hypothetical protein LDENG_00226630, partial [Lucifuga dentata]